MPTKFVTNPRRPAAKKSRIPTRRNYASSATTSNFLRDLRPAQVAQMVREGSLAVTHADIGNGYYTVTLFDDGVGGENRKRVEAKWFVDGEDGWYDLSLGLRDGKVDPSTADLFLGPSRWDKREREEQTRAAAKRKGIDIDASRHYFNNPTTASGEVTPRVFLLVLRSKLTQHDARLSAKQPNLYRLGHYLAAAERVEKAMGRSLDSTAPAALTKFKKSLYTAFEMPFAPASAVERQVDAYLTKGTVPSLTRQNPRAPSVTASVEQDNLSGGWSVYLHAGRRNVNITGDVFSSEAAAQREAKVLLALARAGVSLDTLVSNFYEAYHKPFRRAEHELANPRRNNPPKGFRIAGPAVKTMVDGLRISKADAQKLKDMMDTGAPRILQTADKMMDGNGVERISGVGGGLMYVNMGDTYDTTLIYDYKTNRFVVSSWGDIVERQPRRFAD